MFLLNVPMLLQIGNRTFYCASGEAEIRRDGLDPWPAFSLGGGHALEVHVDCLGPVRNTVVSVDCVKKADSITSYVLTCGASFSTFPSLDFLSVFLVFSRCFGGYLAWIASTNSARPA